MTTRRIALVAAPDQEETVAAISARLPVTGLFNPTRRPWKAPAHRAYPTLAELMSEAEICCFLTPYTSLGNDLQRAIDSGIHVLCAGPPSLSRSAGEQLCQNATYADIRLAWGGGFRHSPLHRALKDRTDTEAFGSPVFLRMVRGGGNSLLAAGWEAYQALEQAAVLLQTAIADLWVTGIRRQRSYHIALTAATARDATAQLVVAPHHPSPVPDISLLGTGGLLSSTEYAWLPSPPVHSGRSLSNHLDLLAEPEWLADFMGRLPQMDTDANIRSLAFFQTLLSTLKRALREGRPVPVHLPGSPIPLSSSG